MVQYRDLNAPPSRMLADVIADMKAQGRQSKTGDHGVKDLGEAGDTTWTTPEGEVKSVRRFAVELDDTAARAAQLEADLGVAAAQLAVAEQNLTALRDVTLPGMRAELDATDTAAQEALTALDDRLGAAESTLTTAQGEIADLQSLLEGTDLEQLQVSLQDALADIDSFQTETMPALEARLQDAEDLLTQLADTDIGDMQVRLTAAESAVSDLQTTTLPALEASLDARIAQGQAETEAALAAASGEITAAQAAIDAARDRLDAHDTTITGQAEVLDVVAKQVSRGPTPPAGAPLGAQWVTPEGYLYVRVDCDEEAA